MVRAEVGAGCEEAARETGMWRRRGRDGCGELQGHNRPSLADNRGQEMKAEVPPQQGMGAGMTRLGDRDPAGCGHKETGRP